MSESLTEGELQFLEGGLILQEHGRDVLRAASAEIRRLRKQLADAEANNEANLSLAGIRAEKLADAERERDEAQAKFAEMRVALERLVKQIPTSEETKLGCKVYQPYEWAEKILATDNPGQPLLDRLAKQEDNNG